MLYMSPHQEIPIPSIRPSVCLSVHSATFFWDGKFLDPFGALNVTTRHLFNFHLHHSVTTVALKHYKIINATQDN